MESNPLFKRPKVWSFQSRNLVLVSWRSIFPRKGVIHGAWERRGGRRGEGCHGWAAMDGEDESLGLLCPQQCTLGGWQDNIGLFGVYRVVLLVNGWMWMFSECVWVNAPVLPKCIEAAAYFDFASGAAEMGRNIHLHSCPYWFIWPFAFEWRSYAWQWKYKSTCTFCVSTYNRQKWKSSHVVHCTLLSQVDISFENS